MPCDETVENIFIKDHFHAFAFVSVILSPVP